MFDFVSIMTFTILIKYPNSVIVKVNPGSIACAVCSATAETHVIDSVSMLIAIR